MVGVGAGGLDLGDGVCKRQAARRQQADQFGDDHRGVGVVDLDGDVLPQRFGRETALRQLVQNQLRPGRHHKILLVDAQQLAVARRVVGV